MQWLVTCNDFRLPEDGSNWVAETCRSNLSNNKLINEKLICAFRWTVLPSIMKMHGPKNEIHARLSNSCTQFIIWVSNGLVVPWERTAVHAFSLLKPMKQNYYNVFDVVTVEGNLCLLRLYNMMKTETETCRSKN